MLSGFEAADVDVGDTTIFIRRKGDGRPLLLLHGFPKRISCGIELRQL
jgi:haloacetate dehalogenase